MESIVKIPHSDVFPLLVDPVAISILVTEKEGKMCCIIIVCYLYEILDWIFIAFLYCTYFTFCSTYLIGFDAKVVS